MRVRLTQREVSNPFSFGKCHPHDTTDATDVNEARITRIAEAPEHAPFGQVEVGLKRDVSTS